MDKRYEINAYYDYNYRDLADFAETDDYEEMKEIVWDFIQQHYVEITDWKTGKRVRYSEPDDIYYDGEIDIDLDPFAESYKKRVNGRKFESTDYGFNGKSAVTIKLRPNSALDDPRDLVFYTTKYEIDKLRNDYSERIWFTNSKGNIKDGRVKSGWTVSVHDIDPDWLRKQGFKYEESYGRTNGRKRNLRESEDKETHRYAVPFSVELHYDYDHDYEIDGLDSDCDSDIYYVINEYVKDAVNSNVELQKINLEVDKDNCDSCDVWFYFTTTPDNLNNTIELLRETFVGVTEDLLEYEETVQTNYDSGTYYGYGIWGDESWDEETINVSVEVEIGDTDGRVEIVDD